MQTLGVLAGAAVLLWPVLQSGIQRIPALYKLLGGKQQDYRRSVDLYHELRERLQRAGKQDAAAALSKHVWPAIDAIMDAEADPTPLPAPVTK